MNEIKMGRLDPDGEMKTGIVISNKTEKRESGTKTGTGLTTRAPGSTAMCIICLYFIFYEKYFILHIKVLKLVFFNVVKSK